MYIAIDIGGTNTRIACFDDLGNPQILKSVSFSTDQSYTNGIQNVIKSINDFNDSEINGIGICVPGYINSDKSEIKVCPQLNDWANKPIKNDLSSQFHCPISLENDAYTAALGETVYGSALQKDFIFIVWGTGIGGTAVKRYADKPVLEAFEPGHMSKDLNGEKCGCGQFGCFNMYASGYGINLQFHKQPEELTEKEWDQVILDFTHCLHSIIMIRPTDLIVLGGGIAINQSNRIDQIKSILKTKLTTYKVPEIRTSKLADQIGLYGALALLK